MVKSFKKNGGPFILKLLFRVGHLTKPFLGPKFPDILVEWSTNLESWAPSD